MGHGAARELSTGDRPIEPIDPALADRLESALKKLDAKDPEFASNRADERHQQNAKAWTNVCIDVVEELRHVGKTIVAQHQILCDCGQEGAGVSTTPFIEEAGQRFPRLEFKLKGSGVVAQCDGVALGEVAHMDHIDYPWLERMAVEWLVWAVHNRA